MVVYPRQVSTGLWPVLDGGLCLCASGCCCVLRREREGERRDSLLGKMHDLPNSVSINSKVVFRNNDRPYPGPSVLEWTEFLATLSTNIPVR